jgi:hypothetical protein
LAMIFCICAFAIWTTWPLSLSYQYSPGEFIPVWVAPSITNPVYTIGLSPSRVTLYYGWTFVTTCCSFVLLVFSTALFAVAARHLSAASKDPDLPPRSV